MTRLSPRTRSGRGRALVRASVLASLMALALPAAVRAHDFPGLPVDGAAAFDRPFYAGAYLGDDATRTERIERSIDAYARTVGKRPALVKSFHRLDVDFSETGWAGQLLRRTSRAGSTPYVALDLTWGGAPSRNLLDAINSGRADRHLVAAARGMAGAGTVLVEPGWEMNGRWGYAWQGVVNGHAEGPAKYRRAFQRIVEIFRREGAGNVRWVFAPNVGNIVGGGWNHYSHYYPGDRYVDILGPHGYNSPRLWGGAWSSFQTMFDGDRMLTELETRWPNKPIIIGEFASDEAGGDKGRWISDAFATMRRHRNVVGAIWFNMRKEADWRVDSSRSALDAYRAVMRDPNIRTTFRG